MKMKNFATNMTGMVIYCAFEMPEGDKRVYQCAPGWKGTGCGSKGTEGSATQNDGVVLVVRDFHFDEAAGGRCAHCGDDLRHTPLNNAPTSRHQDFKPCGLGHSEQFAVF
jgi:hypothetical protein